LAGIPSRLAEIKRDLGAMAAALASKGGGGSASELRSDAGIFFGYGVEETLKRHPDLITANVDAVIGSPAALNTTTTTVFSFPEDHYILAVALRRTVGASASFNSASLKVQPFGDPTTQLLGGWVAAGLIALVTESIYRTGTFGIEFDFPIFGRAETDYLFSVRSGDAATTMELTTYTIRAPQGVEIAH